MTLLRARFYMLTQVYLLQKNNIYESLSRVHPDHAKQILEAVLVELPQIPIIYTLPNVSGKHVLWWYIHIEELRLPITGINSDGLPY